MTNEMSAIVSSGGDARAALGPRRASETVTNTRRGGEGCGPRPIEGPYLVAEGRTREQP